MRRFASTSVKGLTVNDSPSHVVSMMQNAGLNRAFLVLDKQTGKLETSHKIFSSVADSVSNDKRDFHQHEAIFMEIGSRSQALLLATVHKTVRGQAAGGVRYWQYPTLGDFLRDGLRLAQGMGRKNALAGLWWGGGKGGIARGTGDSNGKSPEQFRRDMFLDYGEFMSSLWGCYVTAEDAGVTPPDLSNVFAETRFTTCIPPEKGGSGNPSVTTGLGIVCAMEGALDYLGKKDGVAGIKVAVQGSGNVARYMTGYLLERDVGKVILTDIDENALSQAANTFKKQVQSGQIELRKVPAGDNSILSEEADVVSPCALGGTLNADTIPHIKAKVVCGAANNQLLDDQRDDKLMSKHGRVYVPDFLANRMGIVNCANEQYGYVNHDEAIYRHFGRDWENSIFVKTQEILTMADDKNISSAQAACRIADELANVPHPIWGHRSWNIIQSLVANDWTSQKQ
jgi:glutamate dehydrogenase/leucine dehydrogenase